MIGIPQLWGLILGKSIKGFALGVLSGVVPIYIGEVFQPEMGVKVLSYFQCSVPLGLFLSAVATYVGALSKNPLDKNNIWPSWLLCFLPMSMIFFVSPFIRESPNDYFKLGKCILGAEIVERQIPQKELSDREYKEKIQQRVDQLSNLSPRNDNNVKDDKPTLTSNLKKCFKSKQVITAIFTQCSIQFSGINAFMYYFSEICAMSEVTSDKIPILALALFASNFGANLIGSIYASKVSRVMNMFYGFLIMGLCHMLLFLALQSKKSNVSSEASKADASGTLAIAYCFFAVTSFALAIAVPSMLYTTEIIPESLTEEGIPLSFAIGWLVNFLLTFSLPIIFKYLVSYTFTFFGVFCLVFYAIFLHLEDTHKPNVNEEEGSAKCDEKVEPFDLQRNHSVTMTENSFPSFNQSPSQLTIKSIKDGEKDYFGGEGQGGVQTEPGTSNFSSGKISQRGSLRGFRGPIRVLSKRDSTKGIGHLNEYLKSRGLLNESVEISTVSPLGHLPNPLHRPNIDLATGNFDLNGGTNYEDADVFKFVNNYNFDNSYSRSHSLNTRNSFKTAHTTSASEEKSQPKIDNMNKNSATRHHPNTFESEITKYSLG